MKASVDPDLCIGCELCTQLCSDVFHMGDDGQSHAMEDDIPSELLSDAENARDSCPVSAINLD